MVIRNPDYTMTERRVIFPSRVSSKKGGYPTIFPDETAQLVREKRIVRIHPRTYVFMSIIKHPRTQELCLVPMHSYHELELVEGKWVKRIYPGMLIDDHNPDVHGPSTSKE
jgi:hypothetical protein